jgi:hypothetical protein
MPFLGRRSSGTQCVTKDSFATVGALRAFRNSLHLARHVVVGEQDRRRDERAQCGGESLLPVTPQRRDDAPLGAACSVAFGSEGTRLREVRFGERLPLQPRELAYVIVSPRAHEGVGSASKSPRSSASSWWAQILVRRCISSRVRPRPRRDSSSRRPSRRAGLPCFSSYTETPSARRRGTKTTTDHQTRGLSCLSWVAGCTTGFPRS